jgi:Fe-S-cluster-containing dehydrogenase component
MARMGLLIDYEYCTGCHTCAVACKQEHGYPPGKWGIKVTEYVLEGFKDKVSIDYIPFPTDLCDLCAKRVKAGEQPACVKHCMAGCMYFGPVTELAKQMEKKSKNVLFTPK